MPESQQSWESMKTPCTDESNGLVKNLIRHFPVVASLAAKTNGCANWNEKIEHSRKKMKS